MKYTNSISSRIKSRKSIILSIFNSTVHAYISDDQHETGQTFSNYRYIVHIKYSEGSLRKLKF